MSWKHNQFLSCWVKIRFPCSLALEKQQTPDYYVSSAFERECGGRPGVCPLWADQESEGDRKQGRQAMGKGEGWKKERELVPIIPASEQPLQTQPQDTKLQYACGCHF